MKLILLSPCVVAAIFLLAGCGGGGDSSKATTTAEETTASTAETTLSGTTTRGVAEVELAPMNDSDTSGTATFTDVAEGVQVDLGVQGLPNLNARYLTHIHPGTCAEEQGDSEHDEGTMEEIEYPLPPITPDSEGRGTTTTVLEGVTVEQLFSGSPKYVNVHAEGSGDPPAIACSPLSS